MTEPLSWSSSSLLTTPPSTTPSVIAQSSARVDLVVRVGLSKETLSIIPAVPVIFKEKTLVIRF